MIFAHQSNCAQKILTGWRSNAKGLTNTVTDWSSNWQPIIITNSHVCHHVISKMASNLLRVRVRPSRVSSNCSIYWVQIYTILSGIVSLFDLLVWLSNPKRNWQPFWYWMCSLRRQCDCCAVWSTFHWETTWRPICNEILHRTNTE